MKPNAQVPEAADFHPKGHLEVHSMFETIQGEGPLTGERALFIRLTGCNLRCPGCDTEYTEHRVPFTSQLLRMNVAKRWPRGALVVISGGEPLRQNIGPLVTGLILDGYFVQIETNGVLSCAQLPVASNLMIVTSPKTQRIHQTVFERAHAFKYVLQDGYVDPSDGLPTRALGHPASPRVARPRPGALCYVQPMDEQDEERNRRNLRAAIDSTMMFPGRRLQLQTHKILGME